jgi:cytosine/adenosine deaminase-related metal-dependent hydrolase
MFAECQTLLGRDSGLSPDEVLRMGTVGSAQAMGLTGRVGEIIPGAWADLAAIPFHGSLTDAAAAWVHHGGPVGATLIHGRWEWVQPGFASMDVPS